MKFFNLELYKVFNILIILISAFLIFYTFIRSEFSLINENDRESYYSFFYLITTLNLVYWIIVFVANNKKLTEYSLIILTTSYFSLFLAEIFIIKFNISSSKDIKILISSIKNNVDYDFRDRVQIYKDLKLENKNFTLTISGSNFIETDGIVINDQRYFPLSGISNIETVYCNESGKYSKYKSDKHGFNNDNNIWGLEKIDWVILGDSFAHGACVSKDENFASRIEYYTDEKVLNLGYSGNGPLMSYATSKEYLENKNLNKVIYFYYSGNDLQDLKYELNSSVLKNYLSKDFSQNLNNFSTKEKIDIKLKEFIEKKYDKSVKYNFSQNLKLIKLRDKFINRIILQNKKEKKESSKNKFDQIIYLKKIIENLNEIVALNSGKLYFVYLPSFNNLDANLKDVEYEKEMIKEILSTKKIEFFDIHNLFLKEKNPKKYFPFNEYGHYNKEGYDFISNYIVNKINLN